MKTKCHLFSYFVSLTTLLALSLAGCSRASSKTVQPNDVQLTDANNGGQLTVKAGQTINLQLEANPSTGFGWKVSQVDTMLLAQEGDKTYVPASQNEPVAGGSGWEVFHFTVQQKGETTLKLNYHRSWEEGVEPAKTFEVKIQIE